MCSQPNCSSSSTSGRACRVVATAPNLLTGARAILALAAAAVFIAGGMRRLGIAMCAIALVTDALDGYLARRTGQATPFGGFIDPIADKITIIVIFGAIAWEMRSPVIGGLLAVTVARDAMVTAGRWLTLQQTGTVVVASRLGKVKMIAQSVVCITILALGEWAYTTAGTVVIATLAVPVVLSCWSAWRYAVEWMPLMRNRSTGMRRGCPGTERTNEALTNAKGAVADQDRPPLATVN